MLVNTEAHRYNAEIVAGALLPNESRTLARLMLENTSAEHLHHLLVGENVLQKRSRSTAIRVAGLIQKRLNFADTGMLEIVAAAPRSEAAQALMFLAIKHSYLLGDFMRTTVRERYRRFEPKLRPADWDSFLEACEQVDPTVKQWKSTTRAKLGQVVRKCMFEAGYLDSTRGSNIIPVHLTSKIREYLYKPGHEYVLEAMDILS